MFAHAELFNKRDWTSIEEATGTSYTERNEATLVDQPKGKELEYRVIAVNKAGEGEPLNTKMFML